MAFSNTKKPLKAFRLHGLGQGSTYSILYYAVDSVVHQQAIDSILAVIDSSMSLYKKNSLINQFNASVHGIEIDAHFKKVMRKAFEIYKNSGGIFDVTVKPLVQAWGFGTSKRGAIPDSTTIEQILQHVGTDKLQLKNNFLHKNDSLVQIDLNGIAQGYTVDVMAAFLEQKNIKNYLVEIGGELMVKGKHPHTGKPFTIAAESPDEDVPQKVIALLQGAVTTSGNYRNYYSSGGKNISHLMNAKTGYPLQNEMISVTIVAKDAITADGYDNVLMGLGLEKSFAFLKKNRDMEAHFIYQNSDGAVKDTATAGFNKLLVKP
jgi:thiamine biosynthesis lipoprotein